MSIFRFVQWINEGRPVIVYGDGHQERDFTYVADIARGTVAALKSVGFEVINLGSDQPYALIDIIGRIESFVGKSAQIDYQETAPGDMRATWADIQKAKSLLDWSPEVGVDSGLKSCVRWYEEERSWASRVDTRDK
jgi:nucleoside-diphosphate-sugar epimerase